MVKLDTWGTSLNSRHLGATIRASAEAVMAQEQEVTIDFSGIMMVSHSFADELLGKLIVQLGATAFQERVHLHNVDPEIAPILRFVFRNRTTAAPAPEP